MAPGESPEPELVRRAAAGDRGAFGELVRRHHPAILRLCRSLLSHEADAEDAAQAVFLKAYESLGAFAGRSGLGTWLYRIASNQCLDLLRKRARERSESWEALLERLGPAAEAWHGDRGAELELAQRRRLIDALLAGLSPEYRLALTLRELQGLSYEEIAEAMGCSVDSVKARLRRAREALAQRHFRGGGGV